jgi:hypothetical protein
MQGIAQVLPYAAPVGGSAANQAGQEPRQYFSGGFYRHAAPVGAAAHPGQQPPSYAHPQQLDRGMMEEYRRKMDLLQRQFDAQLRPKLDELKQQVVTVEERVREVCETRDLLLSEAMSEHQMVLEQISLSSDRAVAALTRDLDLLMWDVQRIHDFTAHLAPAPPESPTEVWTGLHRYPELSTLCKQLADKRFKTSVEESAGALREQVRAMRPLTGLVGPAALAAGARPGAGAGGDAAKRAKPAEEQLAELRGLVEVKDQMARPHPSLRQEPAPRKKGGTRRWRAWRITRGGMTHGRWRQVWMMLEERKELQARLTETARERDAHKAEVARRGAEAAGARGELEAACEELRARCEALARDNAQLKSVVAGAGAPAADAPAADAPAAAPAWGRGWTS